MRQAHLAALLLTCTLLGCKRSPTTVLAHHGTFLLTVPAGWSATHDARPTFELVSVAARGEDGMCMLTFTDSTQPMDAAQFLENFKTSTMTRFGATRSEPDALEVGDGRFEGVHFKGRAPGTGVMGALAMLAGEASVELYAGAIGQTSVAVVAATFDATEDKQGVRDGCRALARSLKRSAADEPGR